MLNSTAHFLLQSKNNFWNIIIQLNHSEIDIKMNYLADKQVELNELIEVAIKISRTFPLKSFYSAKDGFFIIESLKDLTRMQKITISVADKNESVKKIINNSFAHGFNFFIYSGISWYGHFPSLNANQVIEKFTAQSNSLYVKFNDTYFFLSLKLTQEDKIQLTIADAFYPWTKRTESDFYVIDYWRYLSVLVDVCKYVSITEIRVENL